MLAHGIHAIRKHLEELPSKDVTDISVLRKVYDAAERVFDVPDGVSVTEGEYDGRPCELLEPTDGVSRALLYLHGGGYVMGSPKSHRHMVAAIAKAANAVALLPDYQLAPEHPFPAALEDAIAGYQWLTDHGWEANQITIAGDSAGGGLTLATLMEIRERGLEMPSAAVCISPWTDMTASGESHRAKASADPMVRLASLRSHAAMYQGERPLNDPLLSPLFGNFEGLSPLLFQVGSEEILLDDAREAHARAKAAGTDSELEIWQDMIHVWHWFGEYLTEAKDATYSIAGFMSRHSPA